MATRRALRQGSLSPVSLADTAGETMGTVFSRWPGQTTLCAINKTCFPSYTYYRHCTHTYISINQTHYLSTPNMYNYCATLAMQVGILHRTPPTTRAIV